MYEFHTRCQEEAMPCEVACVFRYENMSITRCGSQLPKDAPLPIRPCCSRLSKIDIFVLVSKTFPCVWCTPLGMELCKKILWPQRFELGSSKVVLSACTTKISPAYSVFIISREAESGTHGSLINANSRNACPDCVWLVLLQFYYCLFCKVENSEPFINLARKLVT